MRIARLLGLARVVTGVFLLTVGLLAVASAPYYAVAACFDSTGGLVGTASCESTAILGLPTPTLLGICCCIAGAALCWLERPTTAYPDSA